MSFQQSARVYDADTYRTIAEVNRRLDLIEKRYQSSVGTMDQSSEQTLVDAKIAASEARTDTKFARLEGKIDTLAVTLQQSIGTLTASVAQQRAEASSNRTAIITTVVAVGFALAALLLAVMAYGDAIFSRGMSVRDVVAAATKDQQQNTQAAIDNALKEMKQNRP